MKRRYKQLLDKYYETEDEKARERLKQKLHKKYGTNKRCFRCKSQLLVSDLKSYSYLCLECDENMYSFEGVDQKMCIKTEFIDIDERIDGFKKRSEEHTSELQSPA